MSLSSSAFSGYMGEWTPFGFLPKALKEMEDVKIPTRYFDVFDSKTIELCKVLFSNVFQNDYVETPLIKIDGSFAFGAMSVVMGATYDINSYLVDLHLSSRVSIEKLQRIINHLKQEWERADCKVEKTWPPKVKEPTHFLPRQQLGEHIEHYFLDRVIDRCIIAKTKEVIAELPPPFPSDHPEYKLWLILSEEDNPNFLPFSKAYAREWYSYAAEVYSTTAIRVYEYVMEAFEKDKKVREKDPNAPLENLVRLKFFDDKIEQTRVKLYKDTGGYILRLISRVSSVAALFSLAYLFIFL